MPDLRSAIEHVRGELGPDGCLSLVEPGEYAIDGAELLGIAQPHSEAELAAILRLAAEHYVPVVPLGAGSLSHLGGPLSRAGIALSLARLDALVAYEPADLTVTVQAGMTLGALQQRLAEGDQWLPLDPLCPDGATLGGIVAANASGPSRFRFGTPTDMLLGLRAIGAAGETLNAGGRVVKNVAGYDLTSLLVGSLGTLGVIAEMTFKVWPRPAARVTVLGRCESCEQAQSAAQALVSSQLEPIFVELLNQHAIVGRGLRAPPTAHRAAVVAGFAGSAPDVAHQRVEAEVLVRESGMEAQALEGEEERSARAWLRTIIPRAAAGPTGLLTMRMSVLSTEVASAIAKAERLASDFGWRCTAQAHAGNGIVHLVVEAPSPADESVEAVVGLFEAIREEAETCGGWAAVERAPARVKERADVWGMGAPQRQIMAAIKEAFDPAGILSPGRLPNGH